MYINNIKYIPNDLTLNEYQKVSIKTQFLVMILFNYHKILKIGGFFCEKNLNYENKNIGVKNTNFTNAHIDNA